MRLSLLKILFLLLLPELLFAQGTVTRARKSYTDTTLSQTAGSYWFLMDSGRIASFVRFDSTSYFNSTVAPGWARIIVRGDSGIYYQDFNSRVRLDTIYASLGKMDTVQETDGTPIVTSVRNLKFNSSNLAVTSGTNTATINTIQDIHTGATPAFAGLTSNGDLIVNGFLNLSLGDGIIYQDHNALAYMDNTGGNQNIASVAKGRLLYSQGTTTTPIYSANPFLYSSTSNLGFGLTDTSINKNITTIAQSSDSSAIVSSFTNLGKPEFKMTSPTGTTNFYADSVGRTTAFTSSADTFKSKTLTDPFVIKGGSPSVVGNYGLRIFRSDNSLMYSIHSDTANSNWGRWHGRWNVSPFHTSRFDIGDNLWVEKRIWTDEFLAITKKGAYVGITLAQNVAVGDTILVLTSTSGWSADQEAYIGTAGSNLDIMGISRVSNDTLYCLDIARYTHTAGDSVVMNRWRGSVGTISDWTAYNVGGILKLGFDQSTTEAAIDSPIVQTANHALVNVPNKLFLGSLTPKASNSRLAHTVLQVANEEPVGSNATEILLFTDNISTAVRGIYNGGSTYASPAAVGAGKNLLSLSGGGWDSATTNSANVTTADGAIQIFSGSAWTTSSHPTYITFGTTPTGSKSRSERMRIDTLGAITFNSVVRGSDSFTTTATTDTVTVSGGASTDYYFIQLTGAAAPSANDMHKVEALTGKFVVHRSASGTSGLTYNWFRIK